MRAPYLSFFFRFEPRGPLTRVRSRQTLKTLVVLYDYTVATKGWEGDKYVVDLR